MNRRGFLESLLYSVVVPWVAPPPLEDPLSVETVWVDIERISAAPTPLGPALLKGAWDSYAVWNYQGHLNLHRVSGRDSELLMSVPAELKADDVISIRSSAHDEAVVTINNVEFIRLG